MSSTHGFVLPNEAYPTPETHVRTMLDKLVLRSTDKFLEPCRGEKQAIFKQVDLPEEQKFWAELTEGRDYLATDFGEKTMDVIITNPPFSLTTEFMEKSFRELKDDGTLIYLQRVNFLGAVKRVDFWQRVGYPEKFPILIPRPRFVTEKSDSTEYAWFIYDRGNRFPTLPQGISALVNLYI